MKDSKEKNHFGVFGNEIHTSNSEENPDIPIVPEGNIPVKKSKKWLLFVAFAVAVTAAVILIFAGNEKPASQEVQPESPSVPVYETYKENGFRVTGGECCLIDRELLSQGDSSEKWVQDVFAAREKYSALSKSCDGEQGVDINDDFELWFAVSYTQTEDAEHPVVLTWQLLRDGNVLSEYETKAEKMLKHGILYGSLQQILSSGTAVEQGDYFAELLIDGQLAYRFPVRIR